MNNCKNAVRARQQPASRKLVALLVVVAAIGATTIVFAWRTARSGSSAARGAGINGQVAGSKNSATVSSDAGSPGSPSGPKQFDRETAVAEITRLLDAERLSNEQRRRAALMLASDGSEAAMRVLKETLASGDTELQRIVAEALGRCTNAESGVLLRDLLRSGAEPVVIAAVRSLSQQGSPSAVASLIDLLNDKQRTAEVRAEAAQGLGAMTRPEALAALVTAAAQVNDEAVVTEIVRGIAGRSFDETSAFLQTFLEAPNVPADLKAEALQALGQAKGDPTPLLLSYAKNDDGDLRAAAAHALGSLEGAGNSGAEIMAWLSEENDPLVRRRLYKALANQESFDIDAAWIQTASERDPLARIAGLDLLARSVQRNPSAEMISFFDERALPELRGAALNGATRDERMAAVTALRRLNTPNAIAALDAIAAQSRDPRLAEAATRRRPGAIPQ